MQFTGPRPACRALDSLMDEIGDPVVELIENLPLSEEEKAKFRTKFEDILVNTFGPLEGTVGQLRTYIHDLNRELAK